MQSPLLLILYYLLEYTLLIYSLKWRFGFANVICMGLVLRMNNWLYNQWERKSSGVAKGGVMGLPRWRNKNNFSVPGRRTKNCRQKKRLFLFHPLFWNSVYNGNERPWLILYSSSVETWFLRRKTWYFKKKSEKSIIFYFEGKMISSLFFISILISYVYDKNLLLSITITFF